MQAALAAAQAGQRVVLLESRPWLGGFFDYRTRKEDDRDALHVRAAKLREEVEAEPNIRVFLRTNMVGAYADNLITAHQGLEAEAGRLRERYIEVRAKSVVAATGCTERPLLFEHNDKPGVMQPGSALRLARTYGILPGLKGVFSVGDDLGLEAATDLHDLGVSVQAVADIRQDGQDEALVDALKERDIPYLPGWTAKRAEGRKEVQQVRLSPINGRGERRFACDLLGASAGQTPVYGPWAVAPGAEINLDKHTGFFLPRRLPEGMFVAGRLLGLQDAESVEASGRLAGLRAAKACGARVEAEMEQAEKACREAPGPVRGTKLAAGPGGSGAKTFICFDEDATLKHVDQAVQLGFDRPELVKRFAAVGTGPGQNGIPGHNLPLYFAEQQPEAEDTVCPTRLRDPLHPVLLAAYAGRKHELTKRTPAHGLQDRAGGVMERAGVWHRARFFNPERDPYPEVRAVRSNVGLIDVSTLGKLRIFGPDAEKALQRVYVSDMSRVRTERMKYSAMCNHDGCLVDDGVVVKRGENDYYLTTSTGRAGVTAEWIRYHTRFEDWDFHIVNLTDSYGAVNLSGPKAREVLAKLADEDVSNASFPFLGYRELTIRSTIPARAMRLGFVGELSFELHVPSSDLCALWSLLLEAGEEHSIRPFGLEAQSVLRLEKGHVIIGSESEQRTNLLDLGLGFLCDWNKKEWKTVGLPALRRAAEQQDRLTLVGLEFPGMDRTPRDGSIVVADRILGWVCTARWSTAHNKAFGLGLVEKPWSGEGQALQVFEDDGGQERLSAKVVRPPFYDPGGERMRM
jgi:sarcosine oxidase subunit alpha